MVRIIMAEKLVPKLQFNFSSEWNEKKLKDIIQISKEKYNPDSDKKNYKCIELEHLSQETGLLLGYTESINQNSIKNKFHKENILFGKLRPYLKKFYYPNFDGVCSSEIWVFNTQEYSKYIYYLIQTKKFLDISNVSSGSKMPRSDWNFMKEYTFIIPDIQTQKETANLFSIVDNKISLLNKKYQLYQDFKKYLMQNIFTQKLRFDFNDEWKIMRLNEITFYQEGPGVRNYQYTKEGVKLLNVGNFVNNILELDNTDRYISEEEAYGKYNHFLVDEGDLLIACSGIKAEYFDEKIAFAEKEHLPLCMNTSTMRFKSLDENTLNLKYLKYYFQTESFKKQVFRVMTGSAQFNFGPTHLKYFKIPVPCLDEQIKIYQMFESIDFKILNINE